MKFAQLIVTAVFAFLGGMTFQLLDGSTSAQDTGEKEDVTHMKELKVDRLRVKEVLVYDADWKVVSGEWSSDGILLMTDGGASAASLTPRSFILSGKGEDRPSFAAMVDDKVGPLLEMRGTGGKLSGKWSNDGIVVSDGDGAGASLTPTSIILKLKGENSPSFSAIVHQDAGSFVRLNGTNGKLGVSLSANAGKANSAHVDIHDTDGASRVLMGFHDNGKPVVATFDGAGKSTGSIGGK